MSHAIPSRDLSVVIERGVDLLLDHLERKRLGKTRRPRQVPDDLGTKPTGITRTADAANEARLGGIPSPREKRPSRITNAVRREVYARDGLQCTYVAEDGRRCEARAFLELDHTVAKALGGADDAKNLRVLCRAHNQLSTEQTFGRECIEQRRYFRQQKSANEARAATFEKVRVALRGLGFRDTQARNAVATVIRMHDPGDLPTLEQALREALLAATAA